MHNMLVCLDCSALAKKVVPFALALARSFDSHLTLFHVMEHLHVDPCKPVDPVAWEMQKHEAIGQLKAIEASADSVAISSEIVEGKPAEQIKEWIGNNKVDLTVLCSHGENGQSQWALASTSQKLIASNSGSVFLLPATFIQQFEKEEIKYQQILVPLNGSSWAESALPCALKIAETYGSQITLVYILPDPGLIQIALPDSEANELKKKVENYNIRTATLYLENTKSRLSSATKGAIKYVIIERRSLGYQLSEIVQSEAIDLVVMSTNGNSNCNTEFYGKVTFEILVDSDVPVILLREQVPQNENRFNSNANNIQSTPRFPERATDMADNL